MELFGLPSGSKPVINLGLDEGTWCSSSSLAMKSTMYLSWLWLQTNWDKLLGDADSSIQNSIKRLVPCYNPEEECVFLFEFPEDDQVQSAVMRVTGSVLSIVG